MDSIDLSGLSIADPSPSQSDQRAFDDASPLSPKLRDKLNTLAKWRIDPSLIEFPEGSAQFRGGHATVSRALLTPASAIGADLNEAKNFEGGTVKKKAVAVKKLKTENKDSLEPVLELALREAGFLVGLSNPHIINLEGFVEDLHKNRIWLIFPWEEHGNLKDFMASGDWEIPERISLIRDVTTGVEYLHTRSPPICHGDLKSMNVLVTSKYRAVITDLGSAQLPPEKDVDPKMARTKEKTESESELHATFDASSNTITLTAINYTLRWAAPELLMDDVKADLRSDIWALAWVFYEVMTNSLPFANVRQDTLTLKRVVTAKLPPVTDHIRMSLIQRLCSLMVECWDSNPALRPTAQYCQKWISWMPITIPARRRPSVVPDSKDRSPELLVQLGDMCTAQNDLVQARELYTEAFGIFTEISNNAGRALALFNLGRLHEMQDNFSMAAAFYSEIPGTRSDIDDTQEGVAASRSSTQVRHDQKEHSQAVTLYSEITQMFIDVNDNLPLDGGFAKVHPPQNNYSKALALYSKALDIFTDTGNMFGKASALCGLAQVHRLQQRHNEAVPLLTESLQIYTNIGDRFGRANALACLARVHHDQDNYSDAVCFSEQAVEIFKQIGDTRGAQIASSRAAEAHRQLKAVRPSRVLQKL